MVDNYIVTMKVKDAADAAGIPTTVASKRLKLPDVGLAIAIAMDEKSRLSRIDASWVLKRAALMADFNIKNFMVVEDITGALYYDFTQATDDDWYCINEITVGAVRAQVRAGDKLYVDKVKIKTIDKMRALEMVKALTGDRADVSTQVTEVTRKIVAAAPTGLPAPHAGAPVEAKT